MTFFLFIFLSLVYNLIREFGVFNEEEKRIIRKEKEI